MSNDREPIILRTLRISAVTCVSVYLGVPQGLKARAVRAGARNDLRLTNTNDTPLVELTVSGTRESATDLPAPRLRKKDSSSDRKE